ncbi:unnamed protein product, partial [Medioppia subpectinata]
MATKFPSFLFPEGKRGKGIENELKGRESHEHIEGNMKGRDSLFAVEGREGILHLIIAGKREANWKMGKVASLIEFSPSSSKGSESHQELFESCSQLMLSIQKLEVPIKISLAAAAGCQLVASCDIAVASDCSTFSTPG